MPKCCTYITSSQHTVVFRMPSPREQRTHEGGAHHIADESVMWISKGKAARCTNKSTASTAVASTPFLGKDMPYGTIPQQGIIRKPAPDGQPEQLGSFL